MRNLLENIYRISSLMHKKTVALLAVLSAVVVLGTACGLQKNDSPTMCDHDFYLAEYVAASGTQNGTECYVCRKCGYSYRGVVPATGAGNVPQQPTQGNYSQQQTGYATEWTVSNQIDESKQASTSAKEKGGTSRYSTRIELFNLEVYSCTSWIYEPSFTAEATDSKGYRHQDVYELMPSWGDNYFRYDLGNEGYKKLTGTIYIMDALNGVYPVWLEFYDGDDFLFATQKLSSGRNSVEFEIDIEGVQYLTIYAKHSDFYSNCIICEDFFLYK